MVSHRNRLCVAWLALTVALVLAAAGLSAGERTRTSAAPAGETVEMFAAIEQGQIEVRLTAKDSTQCTVAVRNKTDKPLSVKLPEAFAGVPVLAQWGGEGGMAGGGRRGGRGGGGAYGGGGYGGGGGGMQGMGGGMGGMMGGYGGMGGMGMGGMGGGFGFNIAPEKVGKLTVPIVCLDHGKRDPRENVQYEIKPIDKYTDKPVVHEVCKMLGKGVVPQRVAQIAAWHLNNGLSWEQLAAKQRRHVTGLREPYFAPQELQAAMKLVSAATSTVEQQKKDNQKATRSASQSLSKN